MRAVWLIGLAGGWIWNERKAMAKFEYEWQGADKVRKRGEIDAPNREAAFAALRTQGIRAIRVEPKGWERGEGFRGMRKRTVAAIALGAVLASGTVTWYSLRATLASTNPARGDMSVHERPRSGPTETSPSDGRRIAKAAPRRFLPKVWPLLPVTNFFEHASENMLARFAMPGTDPGPMPLDDETIIADFFVALDSDIVISPDDPPDVAALKRIVAGLKDEADIYLRTGMGIADYLVVLRQRQKMEMEYRCTILRQHAPEDATKILSSLGMEP